MKTALTIGIIILFALDQIIMNIPQETRDNIESKYEIIKMAAWMEDVDPKLLTAMCFTETGLNPVIGGYKNKMYGACQINMGVWEKHIYNKYGIKKEDTIIDFYLSMLAGAFVLKQLQKSYPKKSNDLILCLYAVGNAALEFEKDCEYSRTVKYRYTIVKQILDTQQRSWYYRI